MAEIENNQPKPSGRGGYRPGSGRKKGSSTARTREIADQAMKGGITPLEYMLSIVRDVNADEAKRIDCAKSAAPYIHPRLSSIEADITGKFSLGQLLDDIDG